ncbi:MAG: hypothetical protein JNL01_04180 [Bdellovibrionales bacterium]|nr:hypothetical protein [Bdellovibrionales bacterium]
MKKIVTACLLSLSIAQTAMAHSGEHSIVYNGSELQTMIERVSKALMDEKLISQPLEVTRDKRFPRADQWTVQFTTSGKKFCDDGYYKPLILWTGTMHEEAKLLIEEMNMGIKQIAFVDFSSYTNSLDKKRISMSFVYGIPKECATP